MLSSDKNCLQRYIHSLSTNPWNIGNKTLVNHEDKPLGRGVFGLWSRLILSVSAMLCSKEELFDGSACRDFPALVITWDEWPWLTPCWSVKGCGVLAMYFSIMILSSAIFCLVLFRFPLFAAFEINTVPRVACPCRLKRCLDGFSLLDWPWDIQFLWYQWDGKHNI